MPATSRIVKVWLYLGILLFFTTLLLASISAVLILGKDMLLIALTFGGAVCSFNLWILGLSKS